jgi:dolichol-phosphate mannosyltransferase
MAGLVFICLGVFGIYIAKIFDEVKDRPLYIIRDTVGITGKTG